MGLLTVNVGKAFFFFVKKKQEISTLVVCHSPTTGSE